MKRILVIYNPRSSRYTEVRAGVLDRVRNLKGYMVGKYEIEKIGVEKNVEKLTQILENGDLVVSAGGDATGVIAANAIMQSGKDATLAVLPYGNFNDLARTLGTKSLSDVFKSNGQKDHHCQRLYPLEIIVDGELWRYATCYVTIGMTAEAAKTFDHPGVRKILKSSGGRTFGSYFHLAGWYFQNRRKTVFLPKFSLNGVKQAERTSDYLAVNGKSMARVMKGGEDFLRPREFRSDTEKLTSFWRLFKFMWKSIFSRVPGQETIGDVLEFDEPAKVEIQAEGESRVFNGVKKIEIKKVSRGFKIVTGC